MLVNWLQVAFTIYRRVKTHQARLILLTLLLMIIFVMWMGARLQTSTNTMTSHSLPSTREHIIKGTESAYIQL